MKKILSLIVMIALLASTICGCSKSDAESISSVAATPGLETEAAVEDVPAPTDNPAADKEVIASNVEERNAITYPLVSDQTEVTMLIGIPPIVENFDTTQISAFRAAMEATGVNLVINDLGAALLEQYPLIFASNAYLDYDILADAIANYNGSIDAAVEDDIVIPLNDIIEEDMPDYAAFINSEEYAFVKKAITSDSGTIAAISGYTYGNPQGLMIRKDWLDKLGLNVPTTYDEFYEVLSKFKSELNVAQPLLLFEDGSMNSECMSGGYGVGFTNQMIAVDGKVSYSLISDGAKEYLEMMNQWYNEGLLLKDFATVNAKTGVNYDGLWNAGSIGIMGGGTDYLSTSYSGAEDSAYEAIAISDAVKNSGDIIHLGYTPSTDFTINASWSISAGCEQVELVAHFINWLFTDAGSVACSFGIEGEGYELNDNGDPVYTDLVVANPDGMTLFSTQLMYTSFNTPYLQDPRVFDSLYTCEAQAEAREIWNANRDDAWCYHGDMTTEESESYAALFSDIDTYASEMIVKFIVGDEDITTQWDTYVNNIESMGINDCLALKQAAFDRYQAR